MHEKYQIYKNPQNLSYLACLCTGKILKWESSFSLYLKGKRNSLYLIQPKPILGET